MEPHQTSINKLKLLTNRLTILALKIADITKFNVNKNPTDATVCRYLRVFTAKLLYMFRVSQHPSSGVLKTVPAVSGTGHNTGTATSLQRGLIGTSQNSMRIKIQQMQQYADIYVYLLQNYSTCFWCHSAYHQEF